MLQVPRYPLSARLWPSPNHPYPHYCAWDVPKTTQGCSANHPCLRSVPPLWLRTSPRPPTHRRAACQQNLIYRNRWWAESGPQAIEC